MSTRSENHSGPLAEEDIHAYVDGMLDGNRRSMVEAYLAANPDEAARVEAFRAQNIGLHVLFDTTPLIPLPDRLAEMARQLQVAISRRRRGRRAALLAASVSALAAMGVVAWLTMDGGSADRNSTQVAAGAVPAETGAGPDRIGRPIDSAGGDREANTLSLLADHYAGAPVQAPNLDSLGFDLVFQRVFKTDKGPGAQLLYQNGAGDRITLDIGGDQRSDHANFTFVQGKDVSMFYWRRGPLAYGLHGGLRREELIKLARSISRQLGAVGEETEREEIREAGRPAAAPEAAVTAERGEAVVRDTVRTVTPVNEETKPQPPVTPGIELRKTTPAPQPDAVKKPENT